MNTRICTPVGIATAVDAAEKKPSEIEGRPGGEHVVDPQAEAEKACPDGRQDDERVAEDRPLGEGRHDHRH